MKCASTEKDVDPNPIVMYVNCIINSIVNLKIRQKLLIVKYMAIKIQV